MNFVTWKQREWMRCDFVAFLEKFCVETLKSKAEAAPKLLTRCVVA